MKKFFKSLYLTVAYVLAESKYLDIKLLYKSNPEKYASALGLAAAKVIEFLIKGIKNDVVFNSHPEIKQDIKYYTICRIVNSSKMKDYNIIRRSIMDREQNNRHCYKNTVVIAQDKNIIIYLYG